MPTRVFLRRNRGLSSFTLIEILTVIAIIAILAALTLMAGEGVMNQASRSRAKSEIGAFGAALDQYKTDNATYPSSTNYAPAFTGTNSYAANDPTLAGGSYEVSSQILYEALSGKINYLDTTFYTNDGTSYAGNPGSGRSYYTFSTKQLGNISTSGDSGYNSQGSTYVEDPFGNSYGYYAGDTNNPPYNGVGMYDLWSTGGALLTTAGGTNQWISNWQQQ